MAAPLHTDEGLRAARAIRQAHPGIGVLVFSQYIESQSAAELIPGSAAGGAALRWPLRCLRAGC
jgi:hypothetical protein